MASHINKSTCSQQDQVHLRTPSAAFHRSCTVESWDWGENINILFQKVQRFATKFDWEKYLSSNQQSEQQIFFGDEWRSEENVNRQPLHKKQRAFKTDREKVCFCLLTWRIYFRSRKHRNIEFQWKFYIIFTFFLAPHP